MPTRKLTGKAPPFAVNKKAVIILAVVSSSVSADLVRLANAPSLILVFYRVLFAVLLMLPVVAVKNRKELLSLDKKTTLLCMLSGVFHGLHFVAFFEGLRYTSIASATILTSTEVFYVALALVFIFKEKLAPAAWLGIGAAFAGSAVIALSDSGGAGGGSVLKGDLLALLGGLLMAFYTLLGRTCRRSVSSNAYNFLVYLSAVVTVGLIALAVKLPFTGYGPVTLLCALGMTVFCTLLGHSLFNWGLKFVQASYISNAKLLSPVFATVIGIFLFGEYPSLWVVLGSALIIIGVAVYSNQISGQ